METNDLEDLIGNTSLCADSYRFLDGGDVMKIGRSVCGYGREDDEEGIWQLQSLLSEEYQVVPVPMSKVLHLKSACTACRRYHNLLAPSPR